MYTVQNCTFTGVKFPESTMDAIEAIAEAFRQNAEGLTALANGLGGKGVNVGALLKMGQPPSHTPSTEQYCGPTEEFELP